MKEIIMENLNNNRILIIDDNPTIHDDFHKVLGSKQDSTSVLDLLSSKLSINSSYEHYERDHLLAKQSLEISSSELQQLIGEIADKEARKTFPNS